MSKEQSECPLCTAAATETPEAVFAGGQPENPTTFVILQTKNMKGHEWRYMILTTKHVTDIPNEGQAEAYLYYFMRTKGVRDFTIMEPTFAQVPDHFHRVASDLLSGDDYAKIMVTPRLEVHAKVAGQVVPWNKEKGEWTRILGKIQYCTSCWVSVNSKPLPICNSPHTKAYDVQKERSRLGYHVQADAELEELGGKCVCCGFSDITAKAFGVSFLQKDHTMGRGSDSGSDIFRVLCRACNSSMKPGSIKCRLHGGEDF